MAFNNEDVPCEKRIKLDTCASDDVRSINNSFPKIDNLEHFPIKVLLNIFAYVDDIGLLNLATESYRFESIAKIVMNQRYTKEYFVVDESKHNKDTYIDFFERFGKEIRAIDAVIANMNDENHWITSVLDNASNLDKLFLDINGIKSNEQFLLQHVNLGITDLTIDMHTFAVPCTQFTLPDFRNLKHLAIGSYPVFSFESFKELIRNNPGLESLSIGETSRNCCRSLVTSSYPFDELIELIGTSLTQLKRFRYDPGRNFDIGNINEVPNHIIDGFVNALKPLESIALSSTAGAYVNFDELLQRLGSRCTNIKNLELVDVHNDEFEAVGSFEKLERLELNELNYSDDAETNAIESLVERLPFLRELQFNQGANAERIMHSSFLLKLLQKCPSLESITICISPIFYNDLKNFCGVRFFDEFIETVQNPNVKIQISSEDDTFRRINCTITKSEVVWNNKVVLHLAKPSTI